MIINLTITVRPVTLPGPTATATGPLTVPAVPEPAAVCLDCGADLVPLIGDVPGEIRTWFCESEDCA